MTGLKRDDLQKQRRRAIVSGIFFLSVVLFVIIASSFHGNDSDQTTTNSNSNSNKNYELENTTKPSNPQPNGTLIVNGFNEASWNLI